MDKKSILVFGVGELQKSIIQRAQNMGLFVIGIDPCADAYAKDYVDVFEIVAGQDYEGTLAVAKKYHVSGVVTAATDKPLVMMARVAEDLNLPFYSVETAEWSTDKYQMKQRFLKGNVPCAKGRLVRAIEDINDFCYPVIVKPRDNSGSRGVKLCRTKEELKGSINEALSFSHLDSVLVEEFIEGQEYSIESLHYEGKSEVIQFTEKETTEFPYNVELGHKQPANLSDKQRSDICGIIDKIVKCFGFKNCSSHTELKINERGIFVIETSPRLGGGYITSTLVPLSTGINMEDQLLHLSIGEKVDTVSGRINKASGVCFFSYPEGDVKAINHSISEVNSWSNIISFDLKLHQGDHINKITSCMDRYGQFIVQADTRLEVDTLIEKYKNDIRQLVSIDY